MIKIRRARRDSDDIILSRMAEERHISYITPAQVQNDVRHNYCYVLIEDQKIKAFGSIVYCPEYHNWAIKRVCVLEEGRGFGKQIVNYLCQNHFASLPLICTPWKDNVAMRHILEKEGFKMKYIFNTKWCMYEYWKNFNQRLLPL